MILRICCPVPSRMRQTHVYPGADGAWEGDGTVGKDWGHKYCQRHQKRNHPSFKGLTGASIQIDAMENKKRPISFHGTVCKCGF